MTRRDPYRDHVLGERGVTVLLDGVPLAYVAEDEVESIRIKIVTDGERRSGAHVCIVSSLRFPVHIWENHGSRGRAGATNGTFSFQVRSEMCLLRFCPEIRGSSRDALSEAVIDIFHDEVVNPSFGAIRMDDLRNELAKKSAELITGLDSLLTQSEDLCHCYKGKDEAMWVVLHSHRKRLSISKDRSPSYSQLMKYLVGEVMVSDVPLSDLFRKICKTERFHQILASNFTVLKKFLIKFNSEFVWFQDGHARTTKVAMQ